MDKAALNRALAGGDLSSLSIEQRGELYQETCTSLGLNPLASPLGFYSDGNGRLRMGLNKAGTNELRKIHNISIDSLEREFVMDGAIVVYTAKGHTVDGRRDIATGAVALNQDPMQNANAIKTAETQAKHRLMISLGGLGFLDESEIENTPALKVVKATEPVVEVLPEVNNAPATVFVDERREAGGLLPLTLSTAEAFDVAKDRVLLVETHADRRPTGNFVTSTLLTETEPGPDTKLAAEVARQNVDTVNVSAKPAAPAPIPVGQALSIFDMPEEPAPILITPTPPVDVVKPVPVQDSVEAAILNQPTETGVTMPVPIPADPNRPTKFQFQDYHKRCMRITRDVLPKIGGKEAKEAPNYLLPYFRKIFGVLKETLTLDNTTVSGWEGGLNQLEAEGITPRQVYDILKAGAAR